METKHRLDHANEILANIKQIDKCASIVCAIGHGQSTIENPFYWLRTSMDRIDGFISNSLGCIATTPIEVLEKFESELRKAKENGHRIHCNKIVYLPEDVLPFIKSE